MNELESIYNTTINKIVELSSNRTIIEKYLIGTDKTIDVSRMFVRDTKLSLPRLISFMIMPRGGSCQSEINTFYDGIGADTPTKSAFSIKRSLISHSLFPYLNNELLEDFYRSNLVKRWKNKFIIAVDGTTITMPVGTRFEPLYGYATNTQDKKVRIPTARAIVLSDVLNHQILTIQLDSYDSYESETAYRAIQNLPDYIKENAIFIFDRLYISSWFLTVLQNLDIQYVMRCRRNYSNGIDKFWNSPLSSQDIQLSLSAPAWSQKTKARYQSIGIQPDQYRPIFVHLTKSKLPHGEVEVICSRIFGCKLSANQAYALYGLRWQVETAIGMEKNEWKIEIFSGYSKNAILQDIYCKMISYNLCSMAAVVANKKLKVKHRASHNTSGNSDKTDRKSQINVPHRYQVNMNMALYNFKKLIIEIVRHHFRIHSLIVKYLRNICQYYEPMPNGQQFKRYHRVYKSSGKYATFTNYAIVI